MDFLFSLVLSPFIWIKAKRQEWQLDKLIKQCGGIDHIPLEDLRAVFGALKPENVKDEIQQTRASIHHLEGLISWTANSSNLSKLLDQFEADELKSTRHFLDISTLVNTKGEPNLVYKMMRRYGNLPDNALYFHGEAIDRWCNHL